MERKSEKSAVIQATGPAEGEDSEPGCPTFVVKVLFHQNETWQGTIQWLEKRQTRQFRSVIEMLRLMDEAVQSDTGYNAFAPWDR